jgi:hypothetical protein
MTPLSAATLIQKACKNIVALRLTGVFCSTANVSCDWATGSVVGWTARRSVPTATDARLDDLMDCCGLRILAGVVAGGSWLLPDTGVAAVLLYGGAAVVTGTVVLVAPTATECRRDLATFFIVAGDEGLARAVAACETIDAFAVTTALWCLSG